MVYLEILGNDTLVILVKYDIGIGIRIELMRSPLGYHSFVIDDCGDEVVVMYVISYK